MSATAPPSLGSLVDLVHGWYPPSSADSWDRVGLVHGDLDQPVRRILLAVDPAPAVAREAAAWGADLLVTHHPLYLKGVHGFTSQTPKGRTSLTLAGAGCALLAAHTNADQALGGVSEAMALALGLREVRPLLPAPAPALDKLGVMVPVADADRVRDALAAAGAGSIGDYDQASFTVTGQGRFRPLPGAEPTIGSVGEVELVEEERVEVVLPRRLRSGVVAALLAVHPYEEPAYDVVELADLPDPTRGSGRIGVLNAPVALRELAEHAASVFPSTAAGLRVCGDPDLTVSTVALCGGSGDFLLGHARRAGADVYVTSDLRHHPASESVEDGGPALIDVAHWAAESLWLPVLRDRLVAVLNQRDPDDTVAVHVSTINTDPWTFRV